MHGAGRQRGGTKTGASARWSQRQALSDSVSDTYDHDSAGAPGTRPAHERHSGAGWLKWHSLRVKLVLASALWVALVIGITTAAALGIAERALESDLREAARLTAVAVADDLELRTDSLDSSSLTAMLHEFLSAAPSLRDITVFTADSEGTRFAAGTSSAAADVPDALVARAIETATPTSETRGDLTASAAPVVRSGQIAGAVLVTGSLEPVVRLRSEGRLFAAALVGLAILGIMILIYLLLERLVHAPLRQVLEVAGRARGGDLAARVAVRRDDEIGEVGSGINAMLAELELARTKALVTASQTMANVSHQIGTPLNLVSAHVQLLQGELRADPSAQKRLGIIEDQLGRVITSVRSLIEQARPQAATRLVAVRPLLARLMDSAEIRAEVANVRLDVNVPDGLPPVLVDDTQLELALMNLITNAVDAMPEGGRLMMSASEVDDDVVIDVRDTGIGIPAGMTERVFEPWFTTKPAGRGTGLGLSITRDVVRRFGGTVTVESAGQGGTTVRVTLPSARAKSA